MQTKLVLLGTGTPNACPNANGPSSAVVVDFYSVGAGAPGSIESFRAKGLTAHDRSYLTGL